MNTSSSFTFWDKSSARAQTDICMLVLNSVTKDIRVMKEARSLTSHGYSVVIIGLLENDDGSPLEEVLDGIHIVLVPSQKWSDKHQATGIANLPAQESLAVERPLVIRFFRALYYRIIYRFYRRVIYRFYYRLINISYKALNTLPNRFVDKRDARRMIEVLSRIDARVYHAHDYPALALITEAYERDDVQIIYDSHELFFDRQPPDNPNGTLVRSFSLERKHETKLVQKACRIITVSDSIADLMAEKWRVPRPLVIRNAVDIRRLTPLAIEFPTKNRIVVHSGNITFGRHLPELAAALKYLPFDVSLVFMGNPRSHTADPIEKFAQENNLEERLILVPPVSPQAVANTLAQADIGVALFTLDALNYRFAMPNKLFEYIAAGLPILVGQAPDIAQVIEEFQLGIVCNEKDPKAIAEGILQLLEPENHRRFRRNVIKARQTLCWETEEEKLISLYENILE